ncbi:MAG: FecR family protein [Elusimicrobiota bacterium]|nr:FecR family protein [Elusimicrobiota bacterium]
MKKFIFFSLLFCGLLTASDDYGAIVSRVSGDVKALKKGAQEWAAVVKDDVFSSGDIIKTFTGGTCEVYLIDGTIFEVGPNSLLKIDDIHGENDHLKRAIFDLEMGELLSEIEKGLDYRVRTPQAVCAVRGTKFAVKSGKSKESRVAVFKGKVGVTNYDKNGKLAKRAQIVKKMQEARVRLYKKPELSKKLSADMQRIRKRMVKNQARRKKLKKKIIKRRKAVLKARKKKILKAHKKRKKNLIEERRKRRLPARRKR